MHYYTFNIGDYRRDTGHLSLLEHGIYRQLIDSYYLSEKPLPLDKADLMRTHCIRNADEKRAFENVLKDFFTETEFGFVHAGCEKILVSYKEKSDKARASAMARWSHSVDANALRTDSDGNANGMLTNNHKPITNNQEPIKEKIQKEKAGRSVAAVCCPEGVDEQVWNDFVSTRKAKLTQTALDGISREAQKAGWSLEAALRECATRGWRGFKAEWVDKEKPRLTEHQKRENATARTLLRGMRASFDPNTIEMEVSNVKKLVTG